MIEGGEGVHYRQRDAKGKFKKMNPAHVKHREEIETYMNKKTNPLSGRTAVEVVARDVLLTDREKKLKEKKSHIEHLKTLIIIDETTGLFSRDHLLGNISTNPPIESELEKEFEKAKRSGQNVSVAMIDIDSFKQYNDTYGHPEGDVALKIIGDTVKNSLRLIDLPFRYGGEELVVILPQTNIEAAMKAIERVRKAVEEIEVKLGGLKTKLTVSIGVATYPHPKQDEGSIKVEKALDLINIADIAMYDSKKKGKNRVTAITDMP